MSSTIKTAYGLSKKREEVIDALQNAFASQNLDEVEYENRLNEALAAKTLESLEELVDDFPTEIKNKLFPKNVALSNAQATKKGILPTLSDTNTYRAIMNQDKRHFAHLDEKPLSFFSLMGSQEIDLQNAQLEGNRFKIYVECLLGSSKIDLRNENLNGKHIEIWVGGGLGEIKIRLPRGGKIQNETQVHGGELKIKDKRKSWFNKFIKKQTEESPDLQFTFSIHGTYWLGSIEIIY